MSSRGYLRVTRSRNAGEPETEQKDFPYPSATMCGIAGVVGPHGCQAGVVRRMQELLRHRGPDSAGEFKDENAVLGIRRLRIIDLIAGDQPIANEDESIWTVFNGEIYNFQELRNELRDRGHRFHTASDTETLVHGYEEFGVCLPERLEGMFAFAVWDTRSQRLLLARDRLGKKPLVYAQLSDGGIAFASEISALVAHPEVRREVDRCALHLYLSLGYVPSPRTAFALVRKLPPAHRLVWENSTISIQRYWRPPRPGSLKIDRADAAKELLLRLREAVAARLVADVPLGAFLSGGMDSSAVVALMCQCASRVRTFSIGFDESAYSELEHARRVAVRYGTEHEEFVVRPSATEVVGVLARHFGEPFADSSALPTYYLSRLTRRHVTVALSGDGGDDILGGYDRHLAMRLASLLPRSGLAGAPALRRIADLLPAWGSPKHPSQRLRRFVEAAGLPPAERYLWWIRLFSEEDKEQLLTPDFASAAQDDSALEILRSHMSESQSDNPVEQALYADLLLYLPEDLLVKADIVSMANSLEVRSPFLDRRVVEFAVALPVDLKIGGLQRKRVLRDAIADLVPRQNVARPKMGFAVPLDAWFRGELRPLLHDIVLSRRALSRGYFRESALRAIVGEHEAGRRNHGARLWGLLMLELWHHEFVDAA